MLFICIEDYTKRLFIIDDILAQLESNSRSHPFFNPWDFPLNAAFRASEVDVQKVGFSLFGSKVEHAFASVERADILTDCFSGLIDEMSVSEVDDVSLLVAGPGLEIDLVFY